MFRIFRIIRCKVCKIELSECGSSKLKCSECGSETEIGKVNPLLPYSNNTTITTECCNSPIDDSELWCGGCGKLIMGWQEERNHERGRIRTRYASAGWRD